MHLDTLMKYILQSAAVAFLLFLVACSTPGLPPGARVVGGGSLIEWLPPVDGGTAILFEKTTGKIIATQTVNNITSFNFDARDDSGTALLKAAFDTPPTNAQFVLYYVPPRQN